MPSWPKAGEVSFLPAVSAIGVGFASLALRSTSQSPVERLYVSASVSVIWNTTQRPSGETVGAATRFKVARSTSVIGRAMAGEERAAVSAIALVRSMLRMDAV